MQDLTVTLVQPNQLWEDIQGNLDNYERLLSVVEETDLILLPELFQTSFTMNTDLAEEMSGRSIQWLLDCSKKNNAAIYTSLMIKEDGNYFNRAVFIQPDGLIECYDKRKTFGLAKEDEYFTAGDSEQIVSYKGWKFQLQVCYDLRFPEIARNRIDASGAAAYDVLLYVANWPKKRSAHWKALLSARAIENQSYVIGVNRVGTDGHDFSYSGDSMVIDALGSKSILTPRMEAVESFVIKNADLSQIREMLPFLKDR